MPYSNHSIWFFYSHDNVRKKTSGISLDFLGNFWTKILSGKIIYIINYGGIKGKILKARNILRTEYYVGFEQYYVGFEHTRE